MALEPGSNRLHLRQISVEILGDVDARGDSEGWPGTLRLRARNRRYFDRTLASVARLGSLERIADASGLCEPLVSLARPVEVVSEARMERFGGCLEPAQFLTVSY